MTKELNKLTFEEWEKMIRRESPVTEEEIESWKNKYYCGINTYEEYKSLLRHECMKEVKKND